jgi:hypothetical protein
MDYTLWYVLLDEPSQRMRIGCPGHLSAVSTLFEVGQFQKGAPTSHAPLSVCLAASVGDPNHLFFIVAGTLPGEGHNFPGPKRTTSVVDNSHPC